MWDFNRLEYAQYQLAISNKGENRVSKIRRIKKHINSKCGIIFNNQLCNAHIPSQNQTISEGPTLRKAIRGCFQILHESRDSSTMLVSNQTAPVGPALFLEIHWHWVSSITHRGGVYLTWIVCLIWGPSDLGPMRLNSCALCTQCNLEERGGGGGEGRSGLVQRASYS